MSESYDVSTTIALLALFYLIDIAALLPLLLPERHDVEFV